MNNLLAIFALGFLLSCTTTPKKIEREADFIPKEGIVNVENGMGQIVSIKYELYYRDSVSTVFMDTTYFKTIVNEASISAKWSCKFKPTYEPLGIVLLTQKGFNPDPTLKNDSITTTLEFRAKNAFGVPDNLTSYSIFVNKLEIEHF